MLHFSVQLDFLLNQPPEPCMVVGLCFVVLSSHEAAHFLGSAWSQRDKRTRNDAGLKQPDAKNMPLPCRDGFLRFYAIISAAVCWCQIVDFTIRTMLGVDKETTICSSMGERLGIKLWHKNVKGGFKNNRDSNRLSAQSIEMIAQTVKSKLV